MASRSWLESTLQRSTRLGQEVLERASRRLLDWTPQTSSSTERHKRKAVERINANRDDAFETTAELMAQMTDQCQMLYECGFGTETSDAERRHLCRFHPQLVPWTPPGVQGQGSAASAHCFIEVCPGTYSITATGPKSQKKTQVISISAGESVNLTFVL
ncbi:A-kinase-interacting protein 1 [Genypterus blacodes]|uniref:A-kinase-interacting protein 1 n=1 Tax=Genypterus blacodes TaxID=154954 RepID=UPI003F7681C5